VVAEIAGRKTDFSAVVKVFLDLGEQAWPRTLLEALLVVGLVAQRLFGSYRVRKMGSYIKQLEHRLEEQRQLPPRPSSGLTPSGGPRDGDEH
jgi:hypothetical protein